jgi:DeoR/GlpR family transcriptional regulator of sugar metabolism
MINPNTAVGGPAAQDREAELLRLLRDKGPAPFSELAARFEVSEMTVRRLIHKMAAAGLVIRTPGGAMAAPSGSLERSFLERSQHMAAEKDAIGRAAASLVENGETVVMDSGTTTRYVARHLASHSDVTVITPSLAVVEDLAASERVRVQLTGGVYRRSSHDLSGPAMIDSLENVFAGKVFFGAAALSFRKGVMNYDTEIPRVYLRAGKQKILVLDSSKVGIEAVYRFCPIESCDVVITDRRIKSSDLARLRKIVDVRVAG